MIFLFLCCAKIVFAQTCPDWRYGQETDLGYVVYYNQQYFRAIRQGNAYRDPMSFDTYWESVGSVCLPPEVIASSSSIQGSSSSMLLSSSGSVPGDFSNAELYTLQPWVDSSGNIWNDTNRQSLFSPELLTTWSADLENDQYCEVTGTYTASPVDGQEQIRQCFDPIELQGQTIYLSPTATKLGRDAFTICNNADTLSADAEETVIIYLYDHSGSMNMTDSEREGITAFRNIMAEQQTLMPESHAGYVAYGTRLKTTVDPDGMNDSHLNHLQSSIIDDFLDYSNSGTNTAMGMETAQEMLNQPMYEGWKKAIVFFSDGQPSTGEFIDKDVTGPSGTIWTSTLRCYECYLIDNAQNSLYDRTYGIMLAGQQGQLFMSDFVESTGGYSVGIESADSLNSILENVLADIVSSRPPQYMVVKNNDTYYSAEVSSGDSGHVLVQPDSSRNLILGYDIPLQNGLNEIVLETNYRGGEDSKISFYLSVGDEPASQGAQGYFQEQCFSRPTIELVENENPVSLITAYTQELYLVAKTGENYGDSIQVQAYAAASGDAELITLYLEEFSGVYIYKSHVPFQFAQPAEATQHNGLWEASQADSLFFVWYDLLNPSVQARGKAYTYDLPPPVDTVAYYDVNLDGRLDSLHIVFRYPLTTEQWNNYHWDLQWLGGEGQRDDYPLSLDDEALAGNAIGVFLADVPDFELLTWIPDSLGLQPSVQLPTYIESDAFSGNVVHVDHMSPVVHSGRIERIQARENHLILRFSEPLNIQTVPGEKNWLSFQKTGSADVVAFEYKVGGWLDNEHYEILFFEGDSFYVNPGDLVRFSSPADSITDFFGNSVQPENPWAVIDGDYRISRTHSEVTAITDTTGDADSVAVFLESLDAQLDASEYLSQNNLAGMVYGPIKVPAGTSVELSQIAWDISFQVYSSTGQYVAGVEHRLECSDETFWQSGDGDCTASSGRQLLLRWNGRSDEGRKAGTGVYIFRLSVDGKKPYYAKTGLVRR